MAVPAALYRSMARCYDQLGRITPALSYYRRFLALANRRDPYQRRAMGEVKQAASRLQTLFDRTGLRLEVRPDGTEVRIDRREMGRTPLEIVHVTPGAHQVTFWAEGYRPASINVEVAAGSVVPVVVELRPGPSGDHGAASAASSDSWLFVGFTAVTLATAAGALAESAP